MYFINRTSRIRGEYNAWLTNNFHRRRRIVAGRAIQNKYIEILNWYYYKKICKITYCWDLLESSENVFFRISEVCHSILNDRMELYLLSYCNYVWRGRYCKRMLVQGQSEVFEVTRWCRIKSIAESTIERKRVWVAYSKLQSIIFLWLHLWCDPEPQMSVLGELLHPKVVLTSVRLLVYNSYAQSYTHAHSIGIAIPIPGSWLFLNTELPVLNDQIPRLNFNC